MKTLLNLEFQLFDDDVPVPTAWSINGRTNLALPSFPYHPDPVATGSVVASDTECVCCGKARGFLYSGSVYAQEE